MIDRAIRRLNERLGDAYRHLFLVAQAISGMAVAVIAVLLVSLYFRPSAGEVLICCAVACASSGVAVAWALRRASPLLAQVIAWREDGAPGEEQTVAAWDAVTNYSMRSFRANAVCVNLIAAVPVVVAIVIAFGLSAGTLPVLLISCVLPAAYGTILNYVISEALMRPWVEEIARCLPDDFPFVAGGLLIRKRLKLVLPVFTGFVGLVVAAVMVHHGGTRLLIESVAVATAVGLLFSFELTTLLSHSVTAPISALRLGLERVREGDYEARVPVVTSDELGELTHDFNLMAAGLAERKQIRDAFEAYHDADVVPFILDGSYPRSGVAVTVSIMFVDVRGFTSFAEGVEPTEVIATLNQLFEVIVPIVRAHGGHVDKFLGDGLLAVFGAPEGYADHADRAVAAGAEIVAAVNHPRARLPVGVGVNSGTVVAGSIGGAGRFNFSVIGDAVNVAARVEAATRETGDALLLTAVTRDCLVRPSALESRGCVELKGKAAPVEVFALCDPAAVLAEAGAARTGGAGALTAPRL